MTRFIWQFELTGKPWTPQGNWQKDDYKWEIRYFWPIETMVRLNFDEAQLYWDKGICKQHDDIYWLDMAKPMNIKQRHDKYVLKPLVKSIKNRVAYDKKVILEASDLSQIKHQTIAVTKMALQLIIHQKPKCMLELSKIQLQNKTFSSLSIESRCPEMLDDLNAHLQLPEKPLGYVEFLSQQLR